MRLVQGRKGTVELATELVLRFDYGSVIPWMTRHGEHRLHAIAGPDSAVLHSGVALQPANFRHRAEFTVSAGESVAFVMGYSPSYGVLPEPIDAKRALEETKAAWKKWSGQAQASGPYSEAVLRSLITLKALSYGPTGGIVAAPTTSLPERLGGERNWDYRFCWLLAAGCHLHAARAAQFRIYRRSCRMAPVAAPRGCRQSSAGSDHVRACGRAAAR